MNDQRSLTDQLNDLVILANANGLYDAADWVKSQFAKEVRTVRTFNVGGLLQKEAVALVDKITTEVNHKKEQV